MAISLQRLTIYIYSAHRAVIFTIAQLSCSECCWRTSTEKNTCGIARFPCGSTAFLFYVLIGNRPIIGRLLDADCLIGASLVKTFSCMTYIVLALGGDVNTIQPTTLHRQGFFISSTVVAAALTLCRLIFTARYATIGVSLAPSPH